MRVGIKKGLVALSGVVLMAVACLSLTSKQNEDVNALESTNRNEGYASSEYNVAITNNEGYSKIYENKNFEYYYSSLKGVLRIVNKKSGFVWSSGASNKRKKTALNQAKGIKEYSSDYYDSYIDIGSQRNGSDNDAMYAMINSLFSFTYFDDSETSKTVNNVNKISLFGHESASNEWMFKIEHSENELDFKFNLRVTFTLDGMHVQMYDEDIYGANYARVESISPFPHIGQSGGKIIQCRINETDEDGFGDGNFDDLDTIIDNPTTNLSGYIFVPDGSGALIRFDNIRYFDNKVTYYDMYKDPYRSNYSDPEFMDGTLYTSQKDYVESKHISMPVWGVAYGNNQDAFVAYVTEGSEYFGLIFRGRQSTNEYTSIQPRFERNRSYNFKFGSSSSRLILNEDEIYRYDFGVDYNFLEGDGSDGSLPANYVGMALTYRNYLQNNHLVKEDVDIEVGPKVDFLICDVKEGLFGYDEVNVTSFNEANEMLSDLHDSGIENITSTLYGWQNGGVSKSKPWKHDYNNKAGGASAVKKLVKDADKYGYDINFYQQYSLINSAQIATFNAYCVKALSRDYGAYVLSDSNKPITWWEYVNANVSGKWLNKQANALRKLGDNVGISTGGMSTLLIPDYGKDLDYLDSAKAIYYATKDASNKLSLGGDTPNAFLWKNYDSFYNVSVYNSQYQCETDSVPFMEIVLSGIINLYAEYSNFSFYDDTAKLKMIDYNLNPSFIITASENSDVMYTNSRDWFSTSYSSYGDIIKEMCTEQGNINVLKYLNLIKGKTIINREVVEFEDSSLGLYINTYATYNAGVVGDDKVTLAINYFDHDVSYDYNGKTYVISALSAKELN